MALTRLQSNGIATAAVTNTSLASNSVTNVKIADSTIENAKLAAPFTTGKSIAMAIVFS